MGRNAPGVMSTRGRRGPAPKPLTDAMKRFLLDTGKYFYMWTRTGRTALALAKRGNHND